MIAPEELQSIAEGMRRFCILANRHPGGSSSSVELLTTLFYSGVANHLDPASATRDRFVLSKGHAAGGYMFHLWATGRLSSSLQEALTYGDPRSGLPRMPQRDPSLDIELGTGALGQGLSFGIGLAIADRSREQQATTYVLLGDGESTEGQVWEAAMTAPKLGLRNIVALVDANGSGSLIKIDRDAWADRWRGFGWDTFVVDGHNIDELRGALRAAKASLLPAVVIAHTVKGKGLPPAWEGSNQLSSNVPRADIADYTDTSPIHVAQQIVRRLLPQGGFELRPSAITLDVAGKVRTSPVGNSETTKKVGGSLADDLEEFPIMFMSTDAIRNSGIMSRMDRIGEWSWENHSSNVLQLAIAEQDAISIAAGLTAAGVRAMYFSMEAFYWRALDQVRQSIAFAKLPVILVGTSGGIGDLLGPMVQSDSLTLAIDAIRGIEIVEATDVNSARAHVINALAGSGPIYLRLPHEEIEITMSVSDHLSTLGVDGYRVVSEGSDELGTVVCAGATVQRAVAAISRSDHKDHVRIIEVHCMDRFSQLDAVERRTVIETRGFSVAVYNGPSGYLGRALPNGGISVGVDDWGLASEHLDEIYEHYGLSVDSIESLVRKMRDHAK